MIKETAMMNDPETTLRKRLGIYLFFLAHMAAFGTATFHITYHKQLGDVYSVGVISLLTYVLFYLIMFGVDEILWLVITSVLGLLMIKSWLGTLALPFIPDPATAGDRILTDFDDFPARRHILPGAFLVMYTFMLRNMLIDVLGARFNPRRDRYVGWMFVAISGVQILLARLKG